MSNNNPQQMAEIAIKAGTKKATLPIMSILILGFLGGAYIALGYLFNIRVTAGLPEEWGTLNNLIGGMVFPLGLILVVIGGAELLTGNMMAVSMAALAKKVSVKQLSVNWILITITNFVGAIFIAYVFGHLLGLTESGVFLDKTIAASQSKVDASFIEAFISAVGCNWLVALAIWLSYSAEDTTGKIIALFLPIVAFITLGFQHVVANMFIIPAGIFVGAVSWGDYIMNFIPVFLGNAVGGALIVGGLYFGAYARKNKKTTEEVTKMKKTS